MAVYGAKLSLMLIRLVSFASGLAIALCVWVHTHTSATAPKNTKQKIIYINSPHLCPPRPLLSESKWLLIVAALKLKIVCQWVLLMTVSACATPGNQAGKISLLRMREYFLENSFFHSPVFIYNKTMITTKILYGHKKKTSHSCPFSKLFWKAWERCDLTTKLQDFATSWPWILWIFYISVK